MKRVNPEKSVENESNHDDNNNEENASTGLNPSINFTSHDNHEVFLTFSNIFQNSNPVDRDYYLSFLTDANERLLAYENNRNSGMQMGWF